ncbi:MAG: hypothetical protein MUC57_17710 [Desulfobacterales bacterium]|nr:hypothetical protein [Desulfobacterales bacterium]
MDNATITSLATLLLVLVSIGQAAILIGQKRQARLELAESYRKRWAEHTSDFAILVFIGNEPGEYYQTVDHEIIDCFNAKLEESNLDKPTVWALNPAKRLLGFMSDLCQRILEGQLTVRDVYPFLGSSFLRQSRGIRNLLYIEASQTKEPISKQALLNHYRVRGEVQDFAVNHSGLTRRCLILIDLMWAEAARLEDLPPEDLARAASAKRTTGHLNRKRLRRECIRLNGSFGWLRAKRLSRYLKFGEYQSWVGVRGLNEKRLRELYFEKSSARIGEQHAKRLMSDIGDKFEALVIIPPKTECCAW